MPLVEFEKGLSDKELEALKLARARPSSAPAFTDRSVALNIPRTGEGYVMMIFADHACNPDCQGVILFGNRDMTAEFVFRHRKNIRAVRLTRLHGLVRKNPRRSERSFYHDDNYWTVMDSSGRTVMVTRHVLGPLNIGREDRSPLSNYYVARSKDYLSRTRLEYLRFFTPKFKPSEQIPGEYSLHSQLARFVFYEPHVTMRDDCLEALP